MPITLLVFVLASVDGEAARRHAAALAALGPHPWGSPRARAAAEYVAAQLGQAGLRDVDLQEFQEAGLRGVNVAGVLPGRTGELVVVGAHHDTAPGAPGAYDDGGGVGVLIETARTLAQAGAQRRRTLVFVSWDGEEAWSTGRGTTTGSRAWIRALGEKSRDVAAALVIEMCGWSRGTPALQPIAYADPLRPGGYVVAPAWLVDAAQRGSRRAGAPLRLGDPLIAWLYQPAVRTFRVRLYGDDLSFLQSRLPAVFVSDSSFTAYYPWYHQPADTADKLDAAALARMGRSVLGALAAMDVAPRGPAEEPRWFAMFGRVVAGEALLAVAALTVAAALWLPPGRTKRRIPFAIAAGLLLWRHTVPALWMLLLPSLVLGTVRRGWAGAVAAVPALALMALGLAAWLRGFVAGTWLASWDWIALLLAPLLWWWGRR